MIVPPTHVRLIMTSHFSSTGISSISLTCEAPANASPSLCCTSVCQIVPYVLTSHSFICAAGSAVVCDEAEARSDAEIRRADVEAN